MNFSGRQDVTMKLSRRLLNNTNGCYFINIIPETLYTYNSFREKSGSLIKNFRSLNGLLFPAVVIVSLCGNQKH